MAEVAACLDRERSDAASKVAQLESQVETIEQEKLYLASVSYLTQDLEKCKDLATLRSDELDKLRVQNQDLQKQARQAEKHYKQKASVREDSEANWKKMMMQERIKFENLALQRDNRIKELETELEQLKLANLAKAPVFSSIEKQSHSDLADPIHDMLDDIKPLPACKTPESRATKRKEDESDAFDGQAETAYESEIADLPLNQKKRMPRNCVTKTYGKKGNENFLQEVTTTSTVRKIYASNKKQKHSPESDKSGDLFDSCWN
jgi:hypothetical protein